MGQKWTKLFPLTAKQEKRDCVATLLIISGSTCMLETVLRQYTTMKNKFIETFNIH